MPLRQQGRIIASYNAHMVLKKSMLTTRNPMPYDSPVLHQGPLNDDQK